jgi:formylglycine-generating enzyme required for sulfatase activity
MLAGSLPFSGDSSLDTAASILRDEPPALTKIRDDLPSGVQTILSRCLMKDPSKRYASGQELSDALTALQRDLHAQLHGGRSALRTPALLFMAVAVVAVLGVGLSMVYRHYSRIAWARNEALPEIDRLFTSGDRDAALRLLYTASEIIPDDPFLAQYFGSIAIPLTFETDPPGAKVYAKGYNHPERDWILLGETPLPDVPIGMPARLRIEKDGYATYDAAPAAINLHITLFPENEAPAGMVFVPAGAVEIADAPAVDLDSFWIDKYEVTNREYKQFIDDGGYEDDSVWTPGIDRGAFVDTTGRPGPAGWALGAYPDGEDDLPVGGVSWFEANAFATWAGKSLPTVYHWRHAAQQTIFSEILRWSNFDTSGPAPVGSYLGLGPNGTYDMAGNVREWCLNQTGSYRYILGGAWSDPDYLYRNTDAVDPLDRSAINGFRCMRTDQPPSEASMRAIEYTEYDHQADSAVDDRVFELLMQSFEYDDRALDAVIESIDDSPEYWRHEVVTVRAAYGDERFHIHLFLPRNTKPPYQAVVYFPPSSAYFLKDSSNPSFPFAYFIPRTGRALVYPIYAGTYERTVELQGPNDRRDRIIKIGKDLRRTVDYLATRDDIDNDKLAYYGLSWGASLSPTMTVVEPRFAASVCIAGGLYRRPDDWPPIDIPQNFAPRVTVPTLMINGRNDFGAPVETNIQPMFDMLGTPAEDKLLVLLDGGHVPGSVTEIIRESLAWLDKYLGPVDKDN